VVNSIYVNISTGGGNAIGAIYDDTVTNRQRLFGGLTTPLNGGWQNLGAPNLPVTDGQAFDVACVFDSASPVVVRFAGQASEMDLPAGIGRGVPDGGGLGRLSWSFTAGGYATSNPLAESSMTVSATVILFAASFTPA